MGKTQIEAVVLIVEKRQQWDCLQGNKQIQAIYGPDGKNLGDIKWAAELEILFEKKTWENKDGVGSGEINIGQVQMDTIQASCLGQTTSCLPTTSVQGQKSKESWIVGWPSTKESMLPPPPTPIITIICTYKQANIFCRNVPVFLHF